MMEMGRGFGLRPLFFFIFATAKIAHLSDDETVAKMGHPVFMAGLDLGHPP
jgi:hypothetical protein